MQSGQLPCARFSAERSVAPRGPMRATAVAWLVALALGATLVPGAAAPSAAGGRATVSPRDGRLLVEQVDLIVSAAPSVLAVARSYRGPEVQRGLFGPGWSAPFDVVVRSLDPDLLTVRGGGELRAYARDPRTGLFWGPPGEFFQIHADGSVERRSVSGTRERFDRTGRLVETIGLNAAAGPVRLVYGGADRLERIVAPGGRTLAFTYDAQGRVVRVTGPAGQFAAYRYDAGGRLAETADHAGPASRYRYDTGNRLIAIEDSDGTVTFEYDSAGRVARRAWADGRWERFAYDPAADTTRVEYPDGLAVTVEHARGGLLVRTRDSLGGEDLKEYDASGALVRSVSPAGIETVLTYDPLGRLVRRAAADGAVLEQEYLGGTDLVTRRAITGQEWRHEYDSDGNLVASTAPDGGRTTRQYWPNGLPRSVTDPEGATTAYDYDADGHLVAETNPLGGVTRWTRDAAGRVLSMTDPVGGTWRAEYTPEGWLAKAVDATGAATVYRYNAAGRLTAQVDALGRTTRFEYDAFGRLSRTLLPDGSAEVLQYDARGRPSSITDPRGRTVVERYDADGRLAERRTPAGDVVAYTYAANGSWTETRASGGRTTYARDAARRTGIITDPSGAATQLAYDPAGRLVLTAAAGATPTRLAYGPSGALAEVQGPSGERAAYTYDRAGRIARIVHPNGGETRLQHDPLGNVIAVTDASGQTSRLAYDPAGRLTGETDAEGRTTRYAYDGAHRMVRKDLHGGGVVHFRYDAVGNLLRADDGVNPIAYQYDALGRLVRTQYVSLGQTVTYEYDARGLRSKLILAGGQEIRYRYDAAARLAAIEGPDRRTIRLTHDSADRLTDVAYPNGVVGRSIYDAAGRLTALAYRDSSGRVVAGWDHGYDAAGNRVETRDHSGAVTRYRYDVSGQLLEETGPAGTARYRYGPGGDRESSETDGAVVNYRYDAGHRLLEAGSARFQHDRAGRLVQRLTPAGTTTYAYDVEDRLTLVTRPDGTAVRFGYAPTGLRLWREESGVRTAFLYDDLNLLGELDAAGQLRTIYLHGPDLDTPLAAVRGTDWQYLHADVLGSVAAVTADGGGLVGAARYGAFGEPRGLSGAWPVPFAFTGREPDATAELYYYRARYYDPSLGRFLSKDLVPPSLADLRSLNPYVYAGNNPVRFTDPLGLTDWTNAWLRRGGFGPSAWSWGLGEAGAVTAHETGKVTFGPLSWLVGAQTAAAHEVQHVLQMLRPLVRATAEQIRAQGGMMGPFGVEARAAFPAARTLTDAGLRQFTPLEGRGLARSSFLERGVQAYRNLRQLIARDPTGQWVARLERQIGEGAATRALEAEAYAAQGRFAARAGSMLGELHAEGGLVANTGGGFGRWAGVAVKGLGVAANVYTVGSTVHAQVREFREAVPARQAGWEEWKAELTAVDMQDAVVERRLRDWLRRHPELLRPGVTPKDAIAEVLGNLHNGRPPLGNVIASLTDLRTERDRLRRELADAKQEVGKKEESRTKLDNARRQALDTIQLLDQRERERSTILQDLGKLPIAQQRARQADIQRNTNELLEIRKQLTNNRALVKQLDYELIVAKNALTGPTYDRDRLQQKLDEVENTLARLEGGPRP